MNIKKVLLTYQKKILDQNDLSDIGLCGEVKRFPHVPKRDFKPRATFQTWDYEDVCNVNATII